MKKISKKVLALLSIPVGFITAIVSSCCVHKSVETPTCIYGPPSMFEEQIKPKPVVYGPPPVSEQQQEVKDTIIENNQPGGVTP